MSTPPPRGVNSIVTLSTPPSYPPTLPQQGVTPPPPNFAPRIPQDVRVSSNIAASSLLYQFSTAALPSVPRRQPRGDEQQQEEGAGVRIEEPQEQEEPAGVRIATNSFEEAPYYEPPVSDNAENQTE